MSRYILQARNASKSTCRPRATAPTTDGVYQSLLFYGKKAGITVGRLGLHTARATADTNALDAGA